MRPRRHSRPGMYVWPPPRESFTTVVMDDKLLVFGVKNRGSASRDRFNSSGIDLWEMPTGGIIPQSMT